ncbi:MAG: hypothetical protein ACI853_000814 [Paracoccaceae bacterium]|jgi:hypothetical protein
MRLKLFLKRESGAVTVDWVVLAACTIGAGLACVSLLANGTTTAGDTLATALTEIEVN